MAAQESTPVATPGTTPAATPVAAPGDRPDLAAMALVRDELPAGYRQRLFDNEGYTPADRFAAIQRGDTVPSAEILATGIGWFYSSTFQSADDRYFIDVYLSEFADEAAVGAGFDYFEDEARWAETGQTSRDEPGPAAGSAPKETTVGSFAKPFGVWAVQSYVDTTFRVGRVLAGVGMYAVGVAPAPEATLVEELSETLAGRIEMVLAGQAPPGIDLALPSRVLPLFAAWSWPGNSLEGHKDAEEFLGTSGAPAEFAAGYLSGYAVFASTGSAPPLLQHDPPYLDVAVARFATPTDALGVLAVAERLLQRHDGRPITRTEAAEPALAGVDAARAFRSERLPTDSPDSLYLNGAEVVLVTGSALIMVSVLVDADDPTMTVERAEAIALDLATQQVECLRADGPCGPVRTPAALETNATPVAVRET